MKTKVKGWIVPEGYDGRTLKGEVISRALKIDLEVETDDEWAHKERSRGILSEAAIKYILTETAKQQADLAEKPPEYRAIWNAGLNPGSFEVLQEEIRKVIASDGLHAKVLAYAGHRHDCDNLRAMWNRGPCDCGWVEVEAALKEARS